MIDLGDQDLRLIQATQVHAVVQVLKLYTPSHNTSVVTHMLPEMSIQKITRESSTLMEPPVAPPTADTGAGEMMNVVSDLDGISSGIISTSFLVPQNSHTHTYNIRLMIYHDMNINTTCNCKYQVHPRPWTRFWDYAKVKVQLF